MTRIGVCGADGRVGSKIIAKLDAVKFSEFSVVYALVAADSPKVGQAAPVPDLNYLDELPETNAMQAEVFIDFSSPAGTMRCLTFCVEHKIPLIIGTTGHSPAQQEQINQAGTQIVILQSANFSAAVNACYLLLEQAASLLGEDYDVEIVEKHHKHKKDAPSGTALAMGERVAKTRGQDLTEVACYEPRQAARQAGSIGFQAVRGGEIIGEHEVMFIGDEEVITISHKAYSRDIFAAASLRAVRLLLPLKQPGVYTLTDLLKLKP